MGCKFPSPGVEDIADEAAVFLAELLNMTQSLWQLASRNDAVKNIVAGSDAAERAERILASFPQEFALFGVLRNANFTRVVDATDFINGGGLPFDRFVQSFDFEEQYSGGVGGKSGVDIFLDGAKRPAVHHFASCGSDAASSDFGNGLGGVIDSVENSEQSLNGFGLARKLYGNFGDESERAFRSYEESGKVER